MLGGGQRTNPILWLAMHGWQGRGGDVPRGVAPALSGILPLPAVYLRIFGITKDSAGAVLADCTVDLFRTADDLLVDSMVSDGSGNYEFRSTSLSTLYYIVAYKVGSPDVAGTTVNTLVGG